MILPFMKVLMISLMVNYAMLPETVASCTVNITDNDGLRDSLHNINSSSTLCFANHSKLYKVTEFFVIRDLMNIAIKGPVNITCSEGVGLIFINVTNLALYNITIQQCGLTGNNLSMVNYVIQTTVANTSYQFQQGVKIGMFVIASINVTVQNVNVIDTQGIGIACVNVFGLVTFSDVMFINNRPASEEECYKCLFPFVIDDQCLYNPTSVTGSLLLLYANSQVNYSAHNVHVSITRSSFIDNLSCSLLNLFNAVAALFPSLSQTYRNATATAGIKIIFSQDKDSYNVRAEITSSVFKNNSAFVGAAVNVEMFEDASSSSVLVKDCDFMGNGLILNNVSSLPTYGGSISVISNIYPFFPSAFLFEADFSLDIKNCTFTNNSAMFGGAIGITNIFSSNFHANILDCHFEENSGLLGNSIHVSGTGSIKRFTAITIVNSRFVNNSVIGSQSFVDNSQGSYGVVYLSLVNGKLSDTVFLKNVGSAVNLVSSILELDGKVVFEQNRAFHGGALYLQIGSNIVIAKHSRVTFVNNSALSEGGAIFVNVYYLPVSTGRCFLFFDTFDPYCLLTSSCYFKDMNISVAFINNTAALGSALFGYSLECPWLYELGYNGSENVLDFINRTFSDVLSFLPSILNDNVVLTRSNNIMINVNMSNLTIAPGQVVTVGLNASDYYGRSVVAIVGATTLSQNFLTNENYSVAIQESGFQLLQKNAMNPTDIQVNGTMKGHTDIQVYSIFSSAQEKISVELRSCPSFGFYYDSTYRACVCDPDLENTSVTCDYKNILLIKPEDKWVGQLDGKAVVLSCLPGYCSQTTSVDPDDLDNQCSSNRAGVLCGGCKERYGVKIGLDGCSSDCSGAKNFILWLLIVFLYSLWLVCISAFLRFYVSDGFLYGFIFYHNTLFIFRRAFFQSNRLILNFVSSDQVIFSTNSCLFEEMPALAAGGLQFVMPFYVFLLMGMVTVFAKKSNFFNRRFSFSIAKTFATLIYITYNWLLNASFTVLVSQRVKAPSGTEIRWRIDPNVKYFNGWHAGLGVLSLLNIIILSIIALLLLFPGLAYRFKTIQKLKPLIDAFQAPFKLKYSFWIGLQLLSRIILYVLAIIVPIRYQLYCLSIVVLSLLIAQTTISPYKMFLEFPVIANVRNFLDNLFLFFLITHIIEVQSFENIFILSTLCYCITTVIYIILLLYYLLRRFPKIKVFLFKKLCCFQSRKNLSVTNLLSKGDDLNGEVYQDGNDDDTVTQMEFYKDVRSDYANVTSSSINFDQEPVIPDPVDYTQLRESLLDSAYK